MVCWPLLLIWALAKTLPKLFRDRTSAIQKELSDARSATEEASVRLNSVEERLAKLDGQIAEMKAQAEKDAAGEEQRFRAAAEEEKNKILASAEQEIASADAAGAAAVAAVCGWLGRRAGGEASGDYGGDGSVC